jgi:hypothetical protein
MQTHTEVKSKRFASHRRARRECRSRSGTVYIMAMGTSLIVMCLAIAGLQAVRVQRRINDNLREVASASELVKAALEFGQQQVLKDPTWRTRFTHGVPIFRSANGGNFAVTFTDPDDGNIANQNRDPVILTATATYGTATQKMSALFEANQTLFPALRSALYATSEIRFESGSTASANQWAFCETKILVPGSSNINMNCISPSLGGGGYNQRKIVGGVWPMDRPVLDPASISYLGKYYIDNSVTINASDLPTGGTELIANGGFEVDTSNWTGFNCTLTRDTSQKKIGASSCLVKDVTADMIKGANFNLGFWVRGIETQDFYPVITLTGSGSPIPVVRVGNNTTTNAGVWTYVSGIVNVTWTGTLTKAEFQIGSSKSSNFHFDGASLLNADRVVGTRYQVYRRRFVGERKQSVRSGLAQWSLQHQCPRGTHFDSG